MEIRATDDVLDLLDASVVAAAAGAAMELGLFWLLAAKPRPPAEIAAALGVPPRRCAVFLQVLEQAGLLAATGGSFEPSPAAREAILAAYSRETWALLAEEARERRDGLGNLPDRLREVRPSRPRPTYVEKMADDPVRARRFTRMLLELHEPLAASVADVLDLGSATSVLDLGGGSGVVAMALARRHAGLHVTVLDIPTVCAAGREIVAERGMAGRVDHLAVDLRADPLPPGADVAIECDVGLYDEGLFRRVRAALAPGGRFLIVDQLAPDERSPLPHLVWAFDGSLQDPDFTAPTVATVCDLLGRAGFAHVRAGPLAGAGAPEDQLTSGMVLIEAGLEEGLVRPGRRPVP